MVRENGSASINETTLITLGQIHLTQNTNILLYSWAQMAASGRTLTTKSSIPLHTDGICKKQDFFASRAQLHSLKILVTGQQKTLLFSKVPPLLVNEHGTQPLPRVKLFKGNKAPPLNTVSMGSPPKSHHFIQVSRWYLGK